MPSIALMVLATFAAPTPTATLGYAGDTIAHSKGHIAVASRSVESSGAGASAVCHPDPMKGRACRHRVAKAEERRDQRLAAAEIVAADASHKE